MTEETETKEPELCGAPHPWIPHRTCRRVKGHVTDYSIAGILLAPTTHADYAGSWASTEERRGGCW